MAATEVRQLRVNPAPDKRFPYWRHHSNGRSENRVHDLKFQLLQQYFRAIFGRI
jgi:hypothetical protein